MKEQFTGRKKEISILKQQVRKTKASLIVVNGRRRVGKSRLLKEFSKQFDQAFSFSGLPPTKETKAQDQRNEFAKQFMRQNNKTITGIDDWGDLFYQLGQQITPAKLLSFLMKLLGWVIKTVYF